MNNNGIEKATERLMLEFMRRYEFTLRPGEQDLSKIEIAGIIALSLDRVGLLLNREQSTEVRVDARGADSLEVEKRVRSVMSAQRLRAVRETVCNEIRNRKPGK